MRISEWPYGKIEILEKIWIFLRKVWENFEKWEKFEIFCLVKNNFSVFMKIYIKTTTKTKSQNSKPKSQKLKTFCLLKTKTFWASLACSLAHQLWFNGAKNLKFFPKSQFSHSSFLNKSLWEDFKWDRKKLVDSWNWWG
jgi:hypothetical protein